jgi:DNA polymerase lambda
MGSYRRFVFVSPSSSLVTALTVGLVWYSGKADCGDIDIMITRCPDDGKTHAGILHRLLKALHREKLITEDLALPDAAFGEEAIYRGLCRLPQAGSRRRRIDFLTIPWKWRGAALLYYTGDDIVCSFLFSLLVH